MAAKTKAFQRTAAKLYNALGLNILVSIILFGSVCHADEVWKCGSVYTSQRAPGCVEVTTGVARGIAGNRVFAKPQTGQEPVVSASTPVAEAATAPASEDPRISGTLFTTHDDKPLAPSTVQSNQEKKEEPEPTAKCLIDAMLGDKEAAAKCGVPSLSFSDLSKVFQ